MSNTINTLIPKLRFPEFVNGGEWDEKLLGQLVEIKGRIGYRGYTIEDIVSKGNGAISVSPSNINDDGILNIEKSTYISWEKYEESPEIILQNGFTILVKTGSTFGKVAYVKNLSEKATINPQLVVIKPTNIHSFFLYLIISNSSVQRLINQTVVGGAIPTLSQDSVSKFKIYIPELFEQQKIASCLSSFDDLIAAHSQKLEALREHKKGLMQNLFPQGGETVPKYRFPGFDGEWLEKKLGEVCKMQAGKYISASKINEQFTSGLYPCYGGNGLRGFTNSFTHTGTYSLIGRQGALCGNVTFANDKFHATEHAVVVTPENSMDTTWIFYLLELLNLNQYATGQAQPGLSVSNLENVELTIPPSLKEQQKIASCLSSLDATITAQTEKIEQLRLHKKGLMQGLFPKMID